MSPISSAVGRKAKNLPADVKFVQKALNRNLYNLPHAQALAEDGHFGPETEAAIIHFQRSVMRVSNADGRVDPRGPTAEAFVSNFRHPLPKHVAAFLRDVSPVAHAIRIRWGVPASVLVAQAAIESGWGLRVIGNAYFGIKEKSPAGETVAFSTHEVVDGSSVAISDKFRVYENFEEAADDYGRFLRSNPRYASCFAEVRDSSHFVDLLAKAGYATNPNYATKVKDLIRKFALSELDN
jgi:flagellar protein FlgJ